MLQTVQLKNNYETGHVQSLHENSLQENFFLWVKTLNFILQALITLSLTLGKFSNLFGLVVNFMFF